MKKKRSPATMDRIAVRPLGAREGQITLLPFGEISYAFLGSATPREFNRLCLEPRRVYVRTARGVYRTHHRRLAALSRELESAELNHFFPVSRTCLVNALKIAGLDTSAKTPLLVFVAVDSQKEILKVTRRDWPALRDWLRLPRRSGDAPGPAGSGRRTAGDAQ